MHSESSAATERSMSTPTTPKGTRTRIRILTAARQVFARVGYVTLVMGDVAKEAGVSMGALYRYFRNKDDLFLSLIGDIHNELFKASRAADRDFGTEPYEALYEANRGYLAHYHANRDVMRAFIEATTVDDRHRDLWWRMRQRHIDRFVAVLKRDFGLTAVGGIDVRPITESLASMTEQSAYVWYAREHLNQSLIPVDIASEIVTRAWYAAFFDGSSCRVAAHRPPTTSRDEAVCVQREPITKVSSRAGRKRSA